MAAGIAHQWAKRLRIGELEDHLRADIEEQLRADVAMHEAFAIAVKRIGRGSLLNTQFVASASGPENGRRSNTAVVVLKGTVGLLAAWALAVTAVSWLSGVPIALETGASLLGVTFLAMVVGSAWVHGRRRRAEEILQGMFTPDGQELLSLARGEARRLGHDYVGTEHLLLALTIHETGVLAKLLEQVGLAREALREEIENRIKASVAQGLRARPPCTPRLNTAVRLAANEAASGRKQTNADYVLLGLLRERDGVAGSVLRSLGFNAEQVRSSLA